MNSDKSNDFPYTTWCFALQETNEYKNKHSYHVIIDVASIIFSHVLVLTSFFNAVRTSYFHWLLSRIYKQ